MIRTFAAAAISCAWMSVAIAAELSVKDPAPTFKLKNHAGQDFDLKSRQGQWTVLYFYPKAMTPGCTKQACAFRDNIKKIRAEGAEVFGVSTDSVADQAKFHKQEKLNFDLLADADGAIGQLYGAAMQGSKMSQRWTFIIDPQLKLAQISKDVDPVVDSQKIAEQIAGLKKQK